MHLNRGLTSTAIVTLSLLPAAYSWGSLGHETVAYVASNFVSSSTEKYFQSILHNTSASYLASVATWADSFRYTAAGRFSAPFHFIDAEDDPPRSCGVKYVRDCGKKGCVVAAIQNYTSQLLDPDLAPGIRNMATKFIVHVSPSPAVDQEERTLTKQFLGDIHQPLHDENLAIGGNGIKVKFNGVETNLHHVWDTSIPEKLIGGYTLADAKRWADALTKAIKTGIYKSHTGDWLKGLDLRDPISSALIWAGESNALVCTTVLPEGRDGVEETELSGDYYENAIPVVQLQVAKAGYRLAAWLDLIAHGLETEL